MNTQSIILTLTPNWRAYYQLTKPKVVALLLLTALVGMVLALPSLPPLSLLVPGLVGIGLLSAAAAAYNHILDQRIDAIMTRTHQRPLVQQTISTPKALFFATSMAVIGMATLFIWVNALTAWLTFASLIGYAVIYTMYLKRATPQNIAIGGLAGATPPLLGWTAMTGEITGQALLLVMIIFIWTPPHFWALAIHKEKEYAKANIPMLPVTHGAEYTKTLILLYTLLLLPVTWLPWLTQLSGSLYLAGSTFLGASFIYYAYRLKFKPTRKMAFQTFKFSIIHLMTLFLLLLVDHWIINY
ncbi:protoheme IX farnesyltransferase [Moritella sp. 24]|uniref:heme o synthase n=1 Tax=Moritella sp. 24 TaxID=2746230 RepID=UPI001BA8407B|nr:heme o synthase [Moritella sp. 24]QUM77579.1 protoheme IX farnesyltransferase [Moritella sp. 24]